MEKPGNSIGNIVSDAFTSMDIVHGSIWQLTLMLFR